MKEVRRKNQTASFPKMNPTTATPLVEGKKLLDHRRAYLQGHSRRMISASYFSVEALFLLICLTVSLLILPLILPPLPPPPLMLLLLPIGILAVLVVLAFMPSSSDAKDVAQTYM